MNDEEQGEGLVFDGRDEVGELAPQVAAIGRPISRDELAAVKEMLKSIPVSAKGIGPRDMIAITERGRLACST